MQMKTHRLLTSLIVGLALCLSLLITLHLTASAAPPKTIRGVPTLDLNSPIDPPSASSRENGFGDLPPGLVPALARAMANDLPDSYHVQAGASGYQAQNAVHNLATTFDAAGPLVEIAGETWGLALTGWGREGEITPVPTVAPVADGPRLTYRRGPLIEWYLNTTWGLEQGFTLSSPPKRGEGKLVLEMITRGSLRAKQDGDTSLLLVDAEGQTVARYTGLHVYDAQGRDLPARLIARDACIAIHINAADAAYPITVDPWIQAVKLTADDGAAYEALGEAVAIDGDTVVVGAPSGGMFPSPGAVYVFRKPGGSGVNWSNAAQVAKLTADDGAPGDSLGGAVAIDGDAVVAGARYAEVGRGAIYVFVKPHGGWHDIAHTAKLTVAKGVRGDHLGASVAIAGDTIVAGATGDDDYRGAAYVFTQPEGGWRDITATAKLTIANGTADDGLGASVAIAGDTIVAGAKGNAGYRGAAYVFSQPPGGWRDITATAKLTANDGAAYDYLGQSVAIDGDTIVAGAYGDDIGGNDNQGAAYVFVKPEEGWRDITHTAKLTASDGAPWDKLGWAVAIAGNNIVAGAEGVDIGGGSDKGAIYRFGKPAEGWRDITDTVKLTASDGAQWDELGRAIAIDGSTIVAGAPGNDIGDGRDKGAAYVFAQSLALKKSVTPLTDAPYHGAITYTIEFSNTVPVSEPDVFLADTLAAHPVTFARWIVSPTGTLRDNGVITWTGTVPADHPLIWTWVVTHTGNYADVVTNTAEFRSALQTGADGATFTIEEPPVLHVDADAAGPTHDGLSWTTAYTTVQDALGRANAHGTHDYEIWVAEGVYYPDEGAGHTADSESEYFTLSYDNVQLYGGFAATETLRTQRDWQTHVTILSGDIDGNDANADGNHIAETWHVITGSNANHVVWIDGVTYEKITAKTVIDGFTITAGQADGSPPHNDGGGLYCSGRHSGRGCSPTLTNLIFRGNQAAEDGGGMLNNGRNSDSNPVLTNLTLSGNQARYGGGMYNTGWDGVGSPSLINVLLSGNHATRSGGGLYNVSVSNLPLTNVTLSGNQADEFGGGILNSHSDLEMTNVIIWGNEAESEGRQLFNSQTTLVLSYTLISEGENDIYTSDTSEVIYGDGVLNEDPLFVSPNTGNYRLQVSSPAIDAGDNTAPELSGITTDLDGHTRFTDMPKTDTGNGDAPIIDMGAYEAAPLLWLDKTAAPTWDVPYHGTVTYTVVLSNVGGVSDAHILFTDTLPTHARFAAWVAAPPGTLRTEKRITWSGALTAGHAISWTWTVIHTGDYGDEVVNTAEVSGTVQTGVDHAVFIVEEPDVLYVDEDAAGETHDGLSWTTAYTNVQDALDRTQAHSMYDYEIWVAEGVYYPDAGAGHTADSESESFTISHNNVQLYGGFAGWENARDQRDWETHVTILSGDIDGNDANLDGNHIAETWQVITGNNADHVLWLDGVTHENITAETIIDGFTITAGQADGDYPNERGGGLYCDGAGSGHGADNGVCSPTLIHVTFSGNRSDNRGGGMYNDGRDGGESSPALINVAFSGNRAVDEDGGGMYNDGRHDGRSSPTLTNVIFKDNRGDEGGGIYNTGRDGGVSSPVLTNVTISGNEADKDDGGGMYNDGHDGVSNPTLVNAIIWDNGAMDDGHQLYNEDATLVLSYTLIQSGTLNIHNDSGSSTSYFHVLTDYPLFVAPNDGNYRLQADAPAIDAGDNTAPGLSGITTDLDGHTRFADMQKADTGNGDAPIVDMGAYEALPPLRFHKMARPMYNVGHHDAVTYTLTLANTGVDSDTVVLTDTLPVGTTFAAWVISPTGTALANDVITWSGALTAGHTLTWTWRVAHTGDYGDVITNTAAFSSTRQRGQATAAFQVIPAYTITPEAGAGGDISPATPQTVIHGDDITFTIAPDPGQHIVDVQVDGSSVGAVEAYTFRHVAADHTISAVFAPNEEHTLTVGVIGDGTVTRAPNQNTYLHGEVVTLTAEPATDSQFDGWSGDLSGAANPVQVTMNGDKEITAAFSEIPPPTYTLDMHIEGSGAVDLAPDQTGYLTGTVVTLTAKPATHWLFTGWSGDLNGAANPATVTMTIDKAITATFSASHPIYLPLVWRE